MNWSHRITDYEWVYHSMLNELSAKFTFINWFRSHTSDLNVHTERVVESLSLSLSLWVEENGRIKENE